jgi:hypothetical protein
VELDRDECLRLLGTVTRGHLAMNRNALPAIFTIDIRLDGREIVFPVRHLPPALPGSVVCVQAEGDGWSVSVTGAAIVDGASAYVATDLMQGERYSAASLAQ